MTAVHAFELPSHSAAPAEAVDAAMAGHVVHLTRNGEPAAAIVPPDVAAAGAAAIEELEDAEDVRAALAALADPDPSIPMSDVRAAYAADLAAFPGTDLR